MPSHLEKLFITALHNLFKALRPILADMDLRR